MHLLLDSEVDYKLGCLTGRRFNIQGVFFNSPPPKISKCRPVTKFFQKKLEYPDWPPPKIRLAPP